MVKVTRVVKVGGSVLTRKDGFESYDSRSAEKVFDAVAGHPDDVVLVHGAGSFGHPQAEERGFNEDTPVDDSAAAYEIQRSVRLLNDVVVEELLKRDVSAVAVHPSSICVRDIDGDVELDAAVAEAANDLELVPVLHGDVVVDRRGGYTVLSGDDVAVELAREFDAELGMCTSADGVIGEDGETLEHVNGTDDAGDLKGSDVDVTGGFHAKLEKMLKLSQGGRIFGADDLDSYLSGGEPGTLVER